MTSGLTSDQQPARVVSLKELALVVGLSDNSLRALMDRHPDFPVLQRGKNGVAYEIDLDQAKAWLEQHREAVAAERDERQKQLSMWRAELFGEDPDEALQGLTPEQKRAELQAQQLQDRLRRDRGELIERADLERLLTGVMVRLRGELLQVAADWARARGLDRSDRLALEQMIRTRLERAADALGDPARLREAVDRAA